MTLTAAQLVDFTQKWKADTPGNYFVHGDVVSPEFGDEVMFRSVPSAPGGDPTQSKLEVTLPAITPAAYGRQIKINVFESSFPYLQAYGYGYNGVAGRVLLRPAATDGMQDMLDDYQSYGYPYTSLEHGFAHVRAYALDYTGSTQALRDSPLQGPYTVTLTATPPYTADVYTTGGRWAVVTATTRLPQKPRGTPPSILSAQGVKIITQADLTAVTETQTFTLFAPPGSEPGLFMGLRIRVTTGMTLVGMNISASWGPGGNAGLWGHIDGSPFPTFGGFSLHNTGHIVIAPENPAESTWPTGEIGELIINTNGGGGLNTVGAFSMEVEPYVFVPQFARRAND